MQVTGGMQSKDVLNFLKSSKTSGATKPAAEYLAKISVHDNSGVSYEAMDSHDLSATVDYYMSEMDSVIAQLEVTVGSESAGGSSFQLPAMTSTVKSGVTTSIKNGHDGSAAKALAKVHIGATPEGSALLDLAIDTEKLGTPEQTEALDHLKDMTAYYMDNMSAVKAELSSELLGIGYGYDAAAGG
jgi:hypothetical protein